MSETNAQIYGVSENKVIAYTLCNLINTMSKHSSAFCDKKIALFSKKTVIPVHAEWAVPLSKTTTGGKVCCTNACILDWNCIDNNIILCSAPKVWDHCSDLQYSHMLTYNNWTVLDKRKTLFSFTQYFRMTSWQLSQ